MTRVHFLCGTFVILFYYCDLNLGAPPETVNVTALVRTGKQFFSPFIVGFGVGVVRFENGICTASGNFDGTCYTRRQCNTASGIGSTSCASGIGVCCVIQGTCGGSSQINNTYFLSTGFPAALAASSVCSFTIQKIDDNVCQVRLDFLTMRLAGPNANGSCTTDAMVVVGGASIVPVICGENTGQHMYVDFNGNTSITITISTAGGTTVSRAWNIKIAQINCNCPYKAPSGCLQFYNATSGTVQSFNYGSSGLQNGTRQLAGMNYGVCVAMLPGYCGIQWSQSSGDYSFSVTNDTYVTVGTGTIGTITSEIFGSNCTTDFVVIPAPILTSNSTVLPYDRFCGNGFAGVTSYSKPFVLTVVTNNDEVGDNGNRGFSLDFSQVRCTTSLLLG